MNSVNRILIALMSVALFSACQTTDPLITAAGDGDEARVEELIASDRDIEIRDESGDTPLLVAVKNGHEAAYRALKEAGGDIGAINNAGNTALHHALFGVNQTIMMIVYGETDREGALAIAAQYYRIAADLVDSGAPLNHLNKDGLTPLHLAVGQPYGMATEVIVQGLLDAGADPNAREGSDDTPMLRMMYSFNTGTPAILNMLINAGADMNVKNEFGDTPLLKGASEGKAELVAVLLERGADATIPDDDGKTILDYALEGEYEEEVATVITTFLGTESESE